MNKNILIIHYNTPYLTECLVRSINLFIKNANIYIFDNSDKSPFVGEFDNVTIFDNTKGQIINFDKWLEKYKKKNLSNGRSNNWGSAKHCYSVEKCIDLIGENFILLDSDVLLKRDVSNLFSENDIFIGDVKNQPKSTIKRILPFICYINVKMCKEKNVHYFDENYMHGLYYNVNNPKADSYDTGAGFFLHASKYKYSEIDYNNYIYHYGHGSWNKKGFVQQYTDVQWLELHKNLWQNDMNKNVVYTCIVGGYDTLKEPEYVTSGFDYVCFTDDLTIKSDIWEIRPLPSFVEGFSNVKKQRLVKINPHLVLSDYDISIWVDGNVSLKGDLNKLLDENLIDDCSVYVPKHPHRNCIYEESAIVIGMKKDKAEIINPQIERYKSEEFPKNYGLLQSNILIRKHNNADCIKLMEEWTNELKNGSHRDQLSFNYVCWKNKDIKVVYLDKFIYKSEYFHWNGVHSKRRVVQTETHPKRNLIKRLKRNNLESGGIISKKDLIRHL